MSKLKPVEEKCNVFKWELQPTDPLLNWKKGWNEGAEAQLLAHTQSIVELLEDLKDQPQSFDKGEDYAAKEALQDAITRVKQMDV